MTTPTEKKIDKKTVTAYAHDDEVFIFDCPHDCIYTFELQVGDKYYSHEFVYIDADWILDGGNCGFYEWLSQSLIDELPEDTDIEYDYSPEAKSEWKIVVGHLNTWMEKYTNITKLMRPVGKSTEHIVTEEDLRL